ncbi:MAG: hypothetical protein FJW32_01415 [Acidobacteria bacterium]|nr:hypothetical protein [Acidobacteriota bacterium]
MNLFHQAKRVCLGLVSLCLSLTFLGALPGGVSPDRAARNPQRTRVSRCPRHRIVAGISQEPVSLRNAFIRSAKASDPPPVEIAAAAAPEPALVYLETVSAAPQLRAVTPVHARSLFARPPPGLIA